MFLMLFFHGIVWKKFNIANGFNVCYFSILKSYQPDAFVVQCGADGIKGDPIGQSNLTPKVFGHCVNMILATNLPSLFLGGGGYNFANAARNWAYLTSIIVGKEISNDIPDECVVCFMYSF